MGSICHSEGNSYEGTGETSKLVSLQTNYRHDKSSKLVQLRVEFFCSLKQIAMDGQETLG